MRPVRVFIDGDEFAFDSDGATRADAVYVGTLEVDTDGRAVFVPPTPQYADSFETYITSLPQQTIEIDGYFDWPIGERVHIDYDGDGRYVFDAVVTEVLPVNDEGLTTWKLERVD